MSLIVNVVVIFGTTLLSTLSLPSAYTVYVPASRFLIRSGSPSPLVVAVTASIDNAPFEFTNALLVFAATPATLTSVRGVWLAVEVPDITGYFSVK